jgi:hypothetical protein
VLSVAPVQWKSYSHPYCETQSIAHDFFSQFKVVHIVTLEKFTNSSEYQLYCTERGLPILRATVLRRFQFKIIYLT